MMEESTRDDDEVRAVFTPQSLLAQKGARICLSQNKPWYHRMCHIHLTPRPDQSAQMSPATIDRLVPNQSCGIESAASFHRCSQIKRVLLPIRRTPSQHSFSSAVPAAPDIVAASAPAEPGHLQFACGLPPPFSNPTTFLPCAPNSLAFDQAAPPAPAPGPHQQAPLYVWATAAPKGRWSRRRGSRRRRRWWAWRWWPRRSRRPRRFRT